MNHARRVLLGLVICGLFSTIFGSACARNDAEGSVQILITDKPFPVEFIETAVITITKIELRRAGDDTDDGDDNENGNGNANDNDNGSESASEEDSANDESDADGGVDQNTLSAQSLAAGRRRSMQEGGEEGSSDSGMEEDTDTTQADGDLTAGDADPEEESAGEEEEEEEEEEDGQFIVVYDGEKSYDLMALQNGSTNLLADTTLPAGTYTQMRVHTPGGEVTLTDGRSFPLKVPSGSSSGIKMHYTFEVPEGEETILLLHVDLSRAFQPIPGGRIDEAGQIRNFHFRPSVAMRFIDMTEAGSITGTVTDDGDGPLADVWVGAALDGEDVGGTATDETGMYRLIGLPPGNYDLEFAGEGFLDATLNGIGVEAGEETADVDVMLAAEVTAEDETSTEDQSDSTPDAGSETGSE